MAKLGDAAKRASTIALPCVALMALTTLGLGTGMSCARVASECFDCALATNMHTHLRSHAAERMS
jgi:hypothetical protein